MDEYAESSKSWGLVIVLLVACVIVAALLVTDTPGRLFDAQKAQAVAQAADAYARAEIVRAQQSGHTERIQTLALAFTGAQPVLYVLGGLLVGWWLRGKEQRGA